ncbi:hypothetical protein DITRI_Ditri09bG0031400 [Diplodiscus trichospermus]
MARVVLRSPNSQAKIIGTIASISGASVVVLYKGPKLLYSPHWTSSFVLPFQQPLGSPQSNWVIGGLTLLVGYLFFSFWYIIQAIVDCHCSSHECHSLVMNCILEAGLFAVLWGKAKDEEMTHCDSASGSSSSFPLSSAKVSLLQSHRDEEM